MKKAGIPKPPAPQKIVQLDKFVDKKQNHNLQFQRGETEYDPKQPKKQGLVYPTGFE